MVTVNQYHPQLQVSIVTRHLTQAGNEGIQTDFSAAAGGSLLSVSTHKDIGEPAGEFTITLTAERDANGKTWDQKISPMDYVEIRMQRSFTTGTIPIVMRGFVTSTSLDMVEENDQPQFVVTITGHDYGKLLIKAKLFIVLNNGGGLIVAGGDGGTDQASAVATFFRERWGIASQGSNYNLAPYDFINEITTNVLPAFIALKASSTDNTPLLMNDCHKSDFAPEYQVPLGYSQSLLGSVQNILDEFKSNPWFELFVQDDEDGPKLTWRLSPYKNAQGGFLTLGTVTPEDPGTNTLPFNEIIHYSIGRSDDDQYSYFMTIPESMAASALPVREIYGQPEPTPGTTYASSSLGTAVWRRDLTLQYGFNPMEYSFTLIWIDGSLTETTSNAFGTSFFGDMKLLNHWLDNAYGDQYIQMSGTLDVAGRPDYHIGQYVYIKETGQELYIEGVDQSFLCSDTPSYTTKLTLTRGRWPQTNVPYATMTPDYTTTVDGLGPIGSAPYQDGTAPPTSSPTAPSQPPRAPGLPTNPQLGPPLEPIWPVNGPITQAFGVPELGVGAPHTGIDIGVPTGTPIMASLPGTVTFSGGDPSTGFGYYVIINVGNGLSELYGHMEAPPPVAVGQFIAQSQVIGNVDSTGYSTGPHLHFETDLNGTPVNPAPYLPALPNPNQ